MSLVTDDSGMVNMAETDPKTRVGPQTIVIGATFIKPIEIDWILVNWIEGDDSLTDPKAAIEFLVEFAYNDLSMRTMGSLNVETKELKIIEIDGRSWRLDHQNLKENGYVIYVLNIDVVVEKVIELINHKVHSED